MSNLILNPAGDAYIGIASNGNHISVSLLDMSLSLNPEDPYHEFGFNSENPSTDILESARKIDRFSGFFDADSWNHPEFYADYLLEQSGCQIVYKIQNGTGRTSYGVFNPMIGDGDLWIDDWSKAPRDLESLNIWLQDKIEWL